jgi:hypothetical protein
MPALPALSARRSRAAAKPAERLAVRNQGISVLEALIGCDAIPGRPPTAGTGTRGPVDTYIGVGSPARARQRGQLRRTRYGARMRMVRRHRGQLRYDM